MQSSNGSSEMSQTTASSPTDIATPWQYETSVAQVEAIINRIESGQLELAEVFEQFASAVNHLNQCESFLVERKQQMDLLIETLVDTSQS
jgi:exodeoxyribonuclease VII small subunit